MATEFQSCKTLVPCNVQADELHNLGRNVEETFDVTYTISLYWTVLQLPGHSQQPIKGKKLAPAWPSSAAAGMTFQNPERWALLQELSLA